MKRSTAVRHLEHLGEEVTRHSSQWPDEPNPVSMWMADEILDVPDTLDVVTVLVLIDVPVEDLPWRAVNPVERAITERFRLRKLPIWHHGRPSSWPAWNAENRRVRRFWSLEEGTDTGIIEMLRAGEPVDPVTVEPHVFIEQMRTEYTVSRAHLEKILDDYWEVPWRRQHQDFDFHPEDHLWRAAYGLQQIQEALGMTGDAQR